MNAHLEAGLGHFPFHWLLGVFPKPSGLPGPPAWIPGSGGGGCLHHHPPHTKETAGAAGGFYPIYAMGESHKAAKAV